MTFSLYRVAEVSADGGFALLPAYEASGAAVNDLTTAKDCRASAEKLTAWVQTQKLPPDASQTTDQKGKAAFSGRKTGLYLVVGEKTQVGDAVYTSSPSLLSIPEENPETGGWDYAVTMQPKNTVTPVHPDKKPTVPTKKPDKNLPDTGVLHWPIPVLAGAGVACMLLGWRMKRKKF